MLISRRSVVCGLGLVGVGLAQRSGAQGSRTEFRVGYQKAGLLSVAKAQGVFERRLEQLGVEGVKWSEFEPGPAMMDAISAGAVDFGWLGDAPAIIAQSAGAKFVYAACMPASQHGLLVQQGSGLRSLADIQGKKIAFARGTSAQSVVLRLLAKAGLTYADIVPVYLSPRDASVAFSRGEVDAWLIWDPFFAQAERVQQARVIATTKGMAGLNSVYVANADFAAKDSKVLAAAIDEVRKLTGWAARNREQLAQATSAAIGIDLDAERVAIGRTELVEKPITPATVAELQETADAFLRIGVISRPVVIHDAVWSPHAR